VSSQEVFAAESESVTSQMKFYDENDNQIFPYTEEELNQFAKDATTGNSLARVSVYNTEAFTFKSNIWLGGGYNGSAFLNPNHIIMDPSGLAKSFDFLAYYDNGVGAGSQAARISIPGGWTGKTILPLGHLARGNSYRFNLDHTAGTSNPNNFKNMAINYN